MLIGCVVTGGSFILHHAGDVLLQVSKKFFLLNVQQERIIRSVQLPHIPVRAFSQTDVFLVEFTTNSDQRRKSVTNHMRGHNR